MDDRYWKTGRKCSNGRENKGGRRGKQREGQEKKRMEGRECKQSLYKWEGEEAQGWVGDWRGLRHVMYSYQFPMMNVVTMYYKHLLIKIKFKKGEEFCSSTCF